jgi:hypothetical protein
MSLPYWFLLSDEVVARDEASLYRIKERSYYFCRGARAPVPAIMVQHRPRRLAAPLGKKGQQLSITYSFK